MNHRVVDALARVLLYEGYLKNQHRFTYGCLYPLAVCTDAGEACTMVTECLVRSQAATALAVSVRFLHLVERLDGAAPGWQEAVEREVTAPTMNLEMLLAGRHWVRFAFTGKAGPDRRQEAVEGEIELAATLVAADVVRVAVCVRNTSAFDPAEADPRRRRGLALLRALASTHTILGVRDGEFVSLLEPPPELQEAAAGCRNVGTWPVLVGDGGVRDTMLSSPIILYDYRCVARESPGDLFDATEIDELLTLSVLTLADEERRAMRALDARARTILERVEALSPQAVAGLHGAIRRLTRVGQGLQPGDRVRLKPGPRADVIDLALAGKTATVMSLEEDQDGRRWVTVTVDDDPGRDLGAAGQPGHRFFFRVEEVERLT